MKYTIKKGEHSSGFKINPHFFRKKLYFEAIFNYSAKYDLKDENQLDINKLLGYSYFYHHKNSARIGWRWDKTHEKVELFGYVYSRGIRKWKRICSVPPFQYCKCLIETKKDRYDFTVNKVSISIKRDPCNRLFGYRLYPYFGGNMPAPHEVSVNIFNIK